MIVELSVLILCEMILLLMFNYVLLYNEFLLWVLLSV